MAQLCHTLKIVERRGLEFSYKHFLLSPTRAGKVRALSEIS
jgi:hypothetical protein